MLVVEEFQEQVNEDGKFMCGIAGIFQPNARKYDLLSKMRIMVSSMARRGPDGNGKWCADGVGIGHTRLSIIDLSHAADQPMFDTKSGVMVVFNGEIYNYIELRSELAALGHAFSTHSDTEVLLKAYVQWGTSAFSRLIGMWACVFYESHSGRMIACRDRFGIKPLYFKHSENALIFASTIGAILAVEDERPRPNMRVIRDYLLSRSVDISEETFFEGIKRLSPGCYAVVETSGDKVISRMYRYWDVAAFVHEENLPPPPLKQATLTFRRLLEDAVQLHSRSDVEVASCLSGGLDSSSIVALLSAHPSARNLRTFSAVFPGKSYDESSYSALVAARNGVENIQVTPTTATFLADIDQVIQAQEEPFGSTGVYVQWKLFEQVARKGVKVALDGQGADEYLGGYFSFLFPYALDRLLRFKPLKAAQALVGYATGNRFQHYIFQNLPGLLFRLFGLRLAAFRSPLFLVLSPGLRELDTHTVRSRGVYKTQVLNGTGFKKTLARYLTQHSLPSLLRYEDKNSMWFSVEARVPFLEHRLVEYSLQLPINYLIDGRVTKKILREAVSDIVPKEVTARRDKMGFANPESEWVAALVRTGAVKDLLADKGAADFIDVTRFSLLLEGGSGQRQVDSNFVWRVYNLLAWHRQNFAP